MVRVGEAGDVTPVGQLAGDGFAFALQRQQVHAVLVGRITREFVARWQSRTACGGDVGVGRARGVHGQTARRLVAVVEVALVATQAVLLAVTQAGHDVEPRGLQAACAKKHAAVVDVAATGFGHVHRAADFKAGVVLAQDEIHDATDGVGAVDGRSAVFQDLDAVNGCKRDGVQVHRLAVQTVWRHAPTVEQDQGVLRAQATQGNARRAIVGGSARVDRAVEKVTALVADHVVNTGAVGGQGLHQLLGAGDAGSGDVFSANDLDRQRAFALDALDAGARDFNALLGDLRDACRGKTRQHQAVDDGF